MVTIFTPVYNRAYIISKLYESLKRQTDQNFEWIIVDDGSTDHLPNLVHMWKEESFGFPITYRYTSNGGKHRAINLGVKMANSEAFFIVDSDDFLTDDAVEFINRQFGLIAEDNNFAGVSGLRGSYLDQKVIGQTPFFDYVDATNFERGQYGLIGDKAEVYKTSVLTKYPFPEFENENFISENVVWNQIAYNGLKIRWFNKIIYYCEYLKDGLTRNLLDMQRKNPIGWAECIKSTKKYCGIDSKQTIRELYRYFENMHKTVERDKLCQLLDISDEIYQKLQTKWDMILSKVRSILNEEHISTIAVYGMGVTGKRLLLYLCELNIQIAYGIDNNYKEVDFYPVYSIEMNIPEVDSICIAMKYEDRDVWRKIKKKMPKAYIWSVKEIDKELW